MSDALLANFPGEFIMSGQGIPVSEAAMQFFVEAMRANTNVLEQVNKTMVAQQGEIRGVVDKLTDVRERVIRIEATPRVAREIAELRKDIDALKLSQATADGKAATWTWLVRYGPALIGGILVVIASVFIILVASGRIVINPTDHNIPDRPTAVPVR